MRKAYGLDYRVIYVGAQTIFGILFLTLLFLRHSNDRGERLNRLDVLYVLFLITVVLDSIWMVINGVAQYRMWHVVLQVVYLSTMSLTGYVWFLYMLDLFPAKSLQLKKYRFVLGLPVLVEIVLIICSVKTNWVFVVDENGLYIRGPIHIYTILLNYAYMLLGSYVALRSRKEALLTMDKRRFTVAAFFPVPIFVLTIAQLILPPGLPAMQGGVLVAFVLLYGTFQNSMITSDYLTGLPNRYAFEQDLLERIRRRGADGCAHLYLMEGDLNRFKHINDTFGHPAGDEALRLTAAALSEVFTPYGAAVFRTGGDEFMMLAETDASLDIDRIQHELTAKLAQTDAPEGIELSMSLGVQEYDGESDFRTFIEQVDQKLYVAKKASRSPQE